MARLRFAAFILCLAAQIASAAGTKPLAAVAPLSARAVFAGDNQTWILPVRSPTNAKRPSSTPKTKIFEPGPVRIRNTAGVILWQDVYQNLSEAARRAPDARILIVEHLASGHTYRVAKLRLESSPGWGCAEDRRRDRDPPAPRSRWKPRRRGRLPPTCLN